MLKGHEIIGAVLFFRQNLGADGAQNGPACFEFETKNTIILAFGYILSDCDRQDPSVPVVAGLPQR